MAVKSVSLFLLLASTLGSVSAAPVHQYQARDTNMKNFASAMLEIATKNQLWGVGQLGQSYAVGNDVDPTTAHDRTRKLDADLLKVCQASYSNADDNCKYISAYATAAVFAYDRGMTGADFFAGLTTERVDKMNTAISKFCGSGSYGLGCSYLGNGFHSFSAASASVTTPGPFTDQMSQVAILDLVDGATTGMTKRASPANLLNLLSFAPGSEGAIAAGEGGEARLGDAMGGVGKNNKVGNLDVGDMLGINKRDSALNADVNANVNINLRDLLHAVISASVNANVGKRDGAGLDAQLDANVNVNLGQMIRAIVDAAINVNFGKRSPVPTRPDVDVNVGIDPQGNPGVDVDYRRPNNKKRTTYTVGDYTVSTDTDGSGSSMVEVTSPRVNFTGQAAPDGAMFDIQLPNSTLQRGSDNGATALSGLQKKADVHELSSISGVTANGQAGIKYGGVSNSAGGGSTSFGTSADVAATLKQLQSRDSAETLDARGPTDLLNGLPLVGGLLGGGGGSGGASGLLKRDAEDLDARGPTDLLNGLPLVGGLLGGGGGSGGAGGLLKRDAEDLDARGPTDLLNGLPLVGGLLGGGGGSGGAGGLLKRDAEDLDARGPTDLLNGLPLVGGLLGGGGSSGGAGGLLKRDAEALDARGPTDLLNGLPLVGGLLGGGGGSGGAGGLLKRDDESLEARDPLLGNLPLVGGMFGGKSGATAAKTVDAVGGLLKRDADGNIQKRSVFSPMSSGDVKKRHSRSRARRQAARAVAN